MADYTLKEKNFIVKLCNELEKRLNVVLDLNDFHKTVSPTWKDTHIYLIHPIKFSNNIVLFLEIDNDIFKFSFEFKIGKHKSCIVHWYTYLRDKYDKDITIYVDDTYENIEWIISEIAASLNEGAIRALIYESNKQPRYELINLQEVLNEYKVLKK